MESAVTCSRTVEHVVAGEAASGGAGVKLVRMLGLRLQRRLDPFLMLDMFKSDNPDDYLAGFPDHPHRGFESVTYLVEGCMRHRNNAGHEGLLESGDVQWLTAGRGIIHSEMPEQASGTMEGFMLWVNLAAKDKMCAPWYRDFRSAEVPELCASSGARARLIAGRSQGVVGAVERPVTAPLCLDIHLDAGQTWAQVLAADCNAFFCVYRGKVTVGETVVGEGRMAILANDTHADGVVIQADEAARVLLASGMPLNEPIVQYGPFVMNVQQEIYQAVADFQSGRF